jgi:hypothetical protein
LLFFTLILLQLHHGGLWNCFFLSLVTFIVHREIYKKGDSTSDLESQLQNTPEDEPHWRLLSGDIFRTPLFVQLYSILVGVGGQLIVALIFTSFIALFSHFYEQFLFLKYLF